MHEDPIEAYAAALLLVVSFESPVLSMNRCPFSLIQRSKLNYTDMFASLKEGFTLKLEFLQNQDTYNWEPGVP